MNYFPILADIPCYQLLTLFNQALVIGLLIILQIDSSQFGLLHQLHKLHKLYLPLQTATIIFYSYCALAYIRRCYARPQLRGNIANVYYYTYSFTDEYFDFPQRIHDKWKKNT